MSIPVAVTVSVTMAVTMAMAVSMTVTSERRGGHQQCGSYSYD